jgi:hypothetical protein
MGDPAGSERARETGRAIRTRTSLSALIERGASLLSGSRPACALPPIRSQCLLPTHRRPVPGTGSVAGHRLAE